MTRKFLTHICLIKDNYQEIFFHNLIPTLIGTLIFFWPEFISNLNYIQTDPGDTLFNLYIIEHTYNHLTSWSILNPAEFWSPDFFFPISNAKTWSDNLIGPSIIYGIFRSLFNPVQSFTLWKVTTLSLNYISLRFCFKRINKFSSPIWISIITFICSFSPFLSSQFTHPQLFSLFIFGPIIYICNILLVEKIHKINFSHFISLISLVLLNGVFNIYLYVYGYFASLVCISIFIFRKIRCKNKSISYGEKFKSKTIWLMLIISANIIIYIPYLNALKIVGQRSDYVISWNSPKILSWFYSNGQNLLPSPIMPGSHLSQYINGAEQTLFPGWGIIILFIASIITVFKNKNKISSYKIKNWLIAILVMLIITTTIDITPLKIVIAPWIVVKELIPGASSLRAPSRIGLIIILFSGALLSHCSSYWWKPKFSTKKFIPTLILISASILSILKIQYFQFNLNLWQDEVKKIAEELKRSQCKTFWISKSNIDNRGGWARNVMAMHVQNESKVPTLNGYSGHFPPAPWSLNDPSAHRAYFWAHLTRSEDSFNAFKPKDLDTNIGSCNVLSTGKEVIINENIINSKNIFDITESKLIVKSNNAQLFDYYGYLMVSISDEQGNEQSTLIYKDKKLIPTNSKTKYELKQNKNHSNIIRIKSSDSIWDININNGKILDRKYQEINL